MGIVFPLLSLKVEATILDVVASALLLVAVRRIGESMMGKVQKEMERTMERRGVGRGYIPMRRAGWAGRICPSGRLGPMAIGYSPG